MVLGFFTLAATKLPSYWIPATPAAAILIAAATGPRAAAAPRWPQRLAWGATLALATLMAAVLGLAPLWFGQVQDPEMPSLAADVLASGLLSRAALCFALAAGLPLLWQGRRRLLALQLPVMAFAVVALQPLWALGDQLRGAPVRQMATAIQQQRQQGESVAMVGILKPSLHYYSRRVVLYEGIEPADLSNLADRLSREQRRGQAPSSSVQQPSVLVVIDARTAALPHWQGLRPQALAQAGLYRLWRLDRRRLEQRARALAARGIQPTWQRPRPERY
ncbi:MAG: hypothetical protein VKM98_07310 [Cyanobacteriota bacterium]|nr:hypothetical protein [Cyanobacteriota bacterium]